MVWTIGDEAMYIYNNVFNKMNTEREKWETIRTSKYGSKLVSEDTKKKEYGCPRGHRFATTTPIVIAVDDDPEYNSGVVCPYCYVDWFKVTVNAEEDI